MPPLLVLIAVTALPFLSGCGSTLTGPEDVKAAALTDGAVPPDGLVSWWRLDSAWWRSVGQDEVGPNRATPVGTRSTADRQGRRNRALAFDGRSARLTVESPNGIDFDLRQDSYTISLWVRSAVGRRSRLLQKWDERGGTPYAYSLQTTETGLNAVVYDGSTAWLVGVPDLWDGGWHHVAVTFEADVRRLTAYREGQPVARTQVWLASSTRNEAPFSMGGTPVAPTRFFRGELDEVQIYDRALSADEISTLAQ